MKRTTFFMAGLALIAAPVYANEYSSKVEKEKAELRESQQKLREDNADIRHRQQQLEQNRAEKARAKAQGNYGRQAYESMAIGANKAAIKGNEVEKSVDRKMIEKDRADLQNAREMSPSAGHNRSQSGMYGHSYYPQARSLQNDDYSYWQGGRSDDHRRN